MGHPVPRQHPAVVLRSHYTHVRALLVAALIAIVVLAGAVALLAIGDGPSRAAEAGAQSPAGMRYDGGPEEGTRGLAPAAPTGARYDGGPEEGTPALGR